MAGHVSFTNLSNSTRSSAQLPHPHVSSALPSPAVGSGQEHPNSSPLPVAAAGLLSHLHHSGMVPSPLAGRLPQPQVSGSLQTSDTEHLSHLQASGHSQSSGPRHGLSQHVPVGLEPSHPVENGRISLQVSDAQNVSRVSVSPVSDAVHLSLFMFSYLVISAH